MSDIDFYKKSAFFYDHDPWVKSLSETDVPFYLGYAAKYSEEILDIGCGTGRVLIPLALNGFSVFGIDSSESMLEVLTAKISNLPKNIQNKISIKQNSMVDFKLNRNFSLIIIPFRSFCALTTENDQQCCLNSIFTHLRPDGRFILTVFQPNKMINNLQIGVEKKSWEYDDEQTGIKIRKYTKCNNYDDVNKDLYLEAIYRIEKLTSEKEESREQVVLKCYDYKQIKKLICSVGFHIEDEFGYYDKSTISHGTEFIFVCRKDRLELKYMVIGKIKIIARNIMKIINVAME